MSLTVSALTWCQRGVRHAVVCTHPHSPLFCDLRWCVDWTGHEVLCLNPDANMHNEKHTHTHTHTHPGVCTHGYIPFANSLHQWIDELNCARTGVGSSGFTDLGCGKALGGMASLCRYTAGVSGSIARQRVIVPCRGHRSRTCCFVSLAISCTSRQGN